MLLIAILGVCVCVRACMHWRRSAAVGQVSGFISRNEPTPLPLLWNDSILSSS